jgi:Zn-dependent protease with chaperone function
MSTRVAAGSGQAQPSSPTTESQPEVRPSSAEILAAFHGGIEPVRPSPLYRLWILIVAAVMVVLPIIYLGIVALACYAMYWHATRNAAVFHNVRNARAAFLMYFGPLVVLGVLVFFLFKPLFARPERPAKRRSLSPDREPLLFAFVDAVCSAVGAPTPVRIDVDCAVNASASPEHGLFSLLRRRLVLTVGLPLVATLDVKQFAGVLAHEFGHFSQSAGMQFTFLVRSINAWFSRVVYERDQWDATLDSWSQGGNAGTMITANLARFVVWLTRRILWLLMWTGHAISCTMSRQMEYDADRYQARLVGSGLVESILKRLNVVMIAERGAFADLSESWKEGRLVDNLPRLIEANVVQIPRTALDSVDSMIAQRKTGMFDTHPADRDRIAAAKAENAPGIFDLPGPAADLFSEFDGLSQSITVDYYRGVFGPEFTPDHLQPVADVVRGTEHAQEAYKALERLFLGQYSPQRALPLPADLPAAPDDEKAAVERIEQLRSAMVAARENYKGALEVHGTSFGSQIKVEAATIMLKADFRFKAADYGLSSVSLDAARVAREGAERQLTEVAPALTSFEQLSAQRISTALSLLATDTVAERLDEPTGWRREIQSLYPVAAFLTSHVLPRLLPLQMARVALLGVLQNYKEKEVNQRLNNAILSGGKLLCARLQELRTALGDGVLYPFDHAQGEVSLGKFALPAVPDETAIGELLQTAENVFDRLIPLYSRILGRVALAIEGIERAVGLPPLDAGETHDEAESGADGPRASTK